MSNAPDTLTTTETEKLLEFIKNRNLFCLYDVARSRNYLLTLLMLDAGLRVGEAVQLLISDLIINGAPAETLVVRAEITKTKQERILPLTMRLKEQITDHCGKNYKWLGVRSNIYAFEGRVKGHHYSIRSIQLFIAASSTASIGRAITPHTLRHTFATRLMQRTNIRVVQKLLGHTSLASTQIYTHPNQDDLANAIKGLE